MAKAKHHVTVAVRVRPRGALPAAGGGDAGEGEPAVAVSAGDGALVVRNPQGAQSFRYAQRVVLGSDQTESFDAIAAELVARLWDGYSCTLVAYGQTGSGKTYTM